MKSSWDYKEVKNWSFIFAIMSIFSSGWWFTMLTEITTIYDIFTHYLVKMNDWIYKNSMLRFANFCILLGNIPDYKSNKKISQLKTIKIKMMPLPPYYLSLTSIELIFDW